MVVIGGGNTAIDVAREALRLGADDVTLVYRRTEAEMPAFAHEVEEARDEGRALRVPDRPVRFLGDGSVEAIECRHDAARRAATSGRRRPRKSPGSEFLIHADTVVKAIGQRPRAEFLSWIDGIELDRGILAVDRRRAHRQPEVLHRAATRSTAASTVVEAVRGAKLAARAIDAHVGRRT